MGSETVRQLVCDTPADGVVVVRFARPDMREHLYDAESIAECSLFRELRAVAVGRLEPGHTLVLNFGLVDWFPTAFYRFVMRANEEVRDRQARLLLCCLTANVREGFGLMGGERMFPGQVRETEARALFDAKRPAE